MTATKGKAHNIKDFPTLYNPFAFEADRGLSGSPTDKRIIKITSAHRRVIALHMSGWSTMNIARAMDRHYSWVSNVLADSTVRGIVQRLQTEADDQLAALFPLAIHTLKSVMEKGSDGARVNAATTVLKTQGKLKEGEGKQPSAEDVIANIMSRFVVRGKAVISIEGGEPGDPGEMPMIDVTPAQNAHSNMDVHVHSSPDAHGRTEGSVKSAKQEEERGAGSPALQGSAKQEEGV